MSRRSVFPEFVHTAHRFFWPKKYFLLTLYFISVWILILLFLRASPTYEATAIISIKPAPLFNADVGRVAAERPEQFARPQITLLESETVVRRAIASVGEARLYQSNGQATRGMEQIATHLRAAMKYLSPGSFEPLSPADDGYINVKNRLVIRSEPQTDIILVAFTSRDPQLSVDFTNALVQSFSKRYFEVYGNTGAVAFFSDQKVKAEIELALASAKLAEYSSKYSLYSVEEQRRLLLQQRSAASTTLLVTRSSIVDKVSQVTAMSRQMEQMKQPLARSPQLRSLTDQKGADAPSTPAGKSSLLGSSIADDPPLLLVRVYQDTVANLVRANAEIAGLTSMEAEQKKALQEIDTELSTISDRESEIDRLRTTVSQTKANMDVFFKRAFDEQLAQDLNERKFSPVQVLQEATRPLKPKWPKPALLLALGVILCLVPFLAALAVHFAVSGQSEPAEGTMAQHNPSVLPT